ncbi:hypothetical protein ACTXT7_005986 [Hymenolepis weldensis]
MWEAIDIEEHYVIRDFTILKLALSKVTSISYASPNLYYLYRYKWKKIDKRFVLASFAIIQHMAIKRRVVDVPIVL